MDNFMSALGLAVLTFLAAFGIMFILSGSIEHSKQELKFQLILKSNKIDTSSFYWSAKDATSVKHLKNKHTSIVVADSSNYKAWSIDIQEYVAPFDTIDWCKMEIVSYHKKG